MGMKFALFYEIPVPRPWTPESEHEAYKNTLEQAILGDKVGFHSFWTVEHHFLEEYSHCSNPEVLYGAIAARTENIRLGYGVRLLPKPYNHPIRTAESVAVLDLISDGRVEFGTGRSSTRAELEGFDIDPHETREMWSEALGHIVVGVDGGDVPGRRQVLAAWARLAACSPSRCRSRTRRCGARPPAPTGTARSAVTAWGCARSPSVCRPRSWPNVIALYREGLAECTQPVGKFVNDQAATFTMVHCAPTKEEAYEVAAESCAWYVSYGAAAHRIGGRAAGRQGPRHVRLHGRAA